MSEVFVSTGGSKSYHVDEDCTHIGANYSPRDLETAEAWGYDPCSFCTDKSDGIDIPDCGTIRYRCDECGKEGPDPSEIDHECTTWDGESA